MKYDYYILGFINSMGFMITMLVATPHLGKRKGGGGGVRLRLRTPLRSICYICGTFEPILMGHLFLSGHLVN